MLLCAGACRPTTQSRAVDRAVVADNDGAARMARVGVSESELTAVAVQALAENAAFLPPDARAPKGADRRLLRVNVDDVIPITMGSGATGAARVVVTLELSPVAGGAPVRESGMGESAVRPGEAGVGGAFLRALRLAALDAAQAVDQRLGAGGKKDDELVHELETGTPQQREQALRALADRRNPAAVPALIARLSASDPRVVDRAVGALAEIGDRRAVPPLIELAHRRGGRDLAQIARIVGDLGGVDARAWLDTVAIGHEDADVRASAREALAELVAREDAKMAGSAR